MFVKQRLTEDGNITTEKEVGLVKALVKVKRFEQKSTGKSWYGFNAREEKSRKLETLVDSLVKADPQSNLTEFTFDCLRDPEYISAFRRWIKQKAPNFKDLMPFLRHTNNE